MGHRFPQVNRLGMTQREKIQRELDLIKASHLARLSDAQLRAIDEAMVRHGPEMAKKVSKTPRRRAAGSRKTVLTMGQAIEIRRKYIPYVYGLLRLSVEYGVSRSTVLKVVRNQIFKK